MLYENVLMRVSLGVTLDAAKQIRGVWGDWGGEIVG